MAHQAGGSQEIRGGTVKLLYPTGPVPWETSKVDAFIPGHRAWSIRRRRSVKPQRLPSRIPATASSPILFPTPRFLPWTPGPMLPAREDKPGWASVPDVPGIVPLRQDTQQQLQAVKALGHRAYVSTGSWPAKAVGEDQMLNLPGSTTPPHRAQGAPCSIGKLLHPSLPQFRPTISPCLRARGTSDVLSQAQSYPTAVWRAYCAPP